MQGRKSEEQMFYMFAAHVLPGKESFRFPCKQDTTRHAENDKFRQSCSQKKSRIKRAENADYNAWTTVSAND